MGERGTVTWLHLSDLHLCRPKTGDERDPALTTLIADLRRLYESERLRPDLIFITGDLAYGNVRGLQHPLSAQYAEVQAFIDDVRNAYTPPIPLSHIFLVPGNHDVDRDVAPERLAEWLDQVATLANVEDMVMKADPDFQAFLKGLHAYRDFLHDRGYEHLLGKEERLTYAQTLTVNDVDVAVVGLNTAWACTRDQQKSLRAGVRAQIRRLVPDFCNAHLKIALMHHPADWLRADESVKLKSQLKTEFDFCLHGHEHEIALSAETTGYHLVAAGAAFQGENELSAYNIARLNVADGFGRVWMRRFANGRWRPHWIDDQVGDDGVCTLDMSLRRIATRFRAAAPIREETVARVGAAICYTREGGLQFLLSLTSSDRWLFPKASINAGDSPLAVCELAARQKGGVIGTLDETMLSSFDYRRDDAPAVPSAAYLLNVKEQPSRPRNATWYTTQQAVEALMQKRQPHEWWPLVTVVREAWQKLEGGNAGRV